MFLLMNTRFGSKRHRLQAVELSQRSQTAVQIVSKPPIPSNGGPIYHFWASGPCGPDGWLALLLIKWVLVRQIEVRHPHTNKSVFSISAINKYTVGSTIYRYLDLPSTQRIQTHTDSTTSPLQTLVQSPTHSPATAPQHKHRHTSNTPPVPTGLVKPNPLIHSPPTPPRSKHIHILHQLLLSIAR